MRQPTDNESRYQGTEYILTSVNNGAGVEHLKDPSIMRNYQETLMYSQLSMMRELATNDCKPQGTHKNLGPVSKIDELKSMEGDPLKEDN
jgi:hypothetical protein